MDFQKKYTIQRYRSLKSFLRTKNAGWLVATFAELPSLTSRSAQPPVSGASEELKQEDGKVQW